MTKYISLISALSLCFVCSACWLAPMQSNLSSRNGDTFEVTVNGVPTYPIPERYMIDSQGYRARSVNWEAESDGSLCLSITPQNPDVKSIDITLVEVREDRPHTRWRTFTILPRVHDYTETSVPTPIQNHCAKEFFLTPRLKSSKLSPGTYVLGIHVNSHQNWDAQNVKLTVR